MVVNQIHVDWFSVIKAGQTQQDNEDKEAALFGYSPCPEVTPPLTRRKRTRKT